MRNDKDGLYWGESCFRGLCKSVVELSLEFVEIIDFSRSTQLNHSFTQQLMLWADFLITRRWNFFNERLFPFLSLFNIFFCQLSNIFFGYFSKSKQMIWWLEICLHGVIGIARSNDGLWNVTGLLFDSWESILFGRPGWAFWVCWRAT